MSIIIILQRKSKILIQNLLRFRNNHFTYMAIMLPVDNTEKSLAKRAFSIHVFLAFSKVLALLIMIYSTVDPGTLWYLKHCTETMSDLLR